MSRIGNHMKVKLAVDIRNTANHAITEDRNVFKL